MPRLLMNEIAEKVIAIEQKLDERGIVIHELRDRLQGMELRFALLEARFAENAVVTSSIESGTKDLLEIFDSLKGGFKVLGWIGSLAKPFAAIASLIAAGYSLYARFK